MTAATGAFGSAPIEAEEETGLLARIRPAEGWLTVGILLFMLLAIAWAVDDAQWAGIGADGKSATGFLPAAIALGALVGLLGARSRLSPGWVHAIGAVVAVPYLLVTVAGVISTADSLAVRLGALNASTAQFYHDLFVNGIRSAEISPFLLSVGAIAWATGQFAAFNLFRRRRALGVVLFTGLVMLIEVSITLTPQYRFLIMFSAAALVLLVRINYLDQREAWFERRIGDAGHLSEVFLRGGALFLVATMAGSVLLAATASSAPLATMWRNVDEHLVRVGSDLNRIVGGVSGAARGPSGLFTSTQTIRGVWEASREIAFRSSSSDGEAYYWRAATYDDFDGTTWQQLDRAQPVRVAPGQDLLSETAEPIGEEDRARREVQLTLTAVDLGGDVLLAPDAPTALDREADVVTSSPGGPLALIQLADGLRPGDSYTVSALVPVDDEKQGGVTANQLAAAGVSYPDWAERYIRIRPGSVGKPTFDTSNAIVAALPASQRDPYHVAEAVQRYLYREGNFRYRTDVRGLCGSQKLVDCFLRTKVGYCEYFATGMAMLLRAQQIPARVAMGYLPGKPLPNGQREVDRGAAHAWVEVYFPRYGWVRFDPTPGNTENGQTPTRLDPGPVVQPSGSAPSGGAAPSPTFGASDRGAVDDALGEERRSPVAGGTTDAGSSGASGAPVVPIVAGLGLVALVLLGVALARSTRVSEPDIAYRGMVRLAGRLGHAPRPTQTAYEYAGSLGALVPAVRTELHTVARAKVESVYAGRPLDEGLAADLRAAYRRVRIGLLRLALRRPRLPRRSGRVGQVLIRRK